MPVLVSLRNIAYRIPQQLRMPLCITLVYIVVLLPYINSSPVHRYEATDIPQFLGSAVNHVRYGLGSTYGRDFYKDHVTRYLNHPGGLSVTLSLFVRAFGESYAVARMLPILFNAGTLFLLLYSIGKTKLPRLIVAMIVMSMPILVVYGRDLVTYPGVLFFLTLLLVLYVYWRNAIRPELFYVLLFLTSFLTASYDWNGFLVFPLIFLWELQTRRDVKTMGVIVAACLAAWGVILWQNMMITGSAFAPFIKAFSQGEHYERIIVYGYSETYTALSWFQKQGEFLSKNFTGPALLAGVFGAGMSIRRMIQRRPLSKIEQVAWANAAVGLGYSFLTAPWAYIHSYMQLAFIPAIMLFAGLFFLRLPERYTKIAIVLYIIFSLPLSTFIIWKFYEWYR